MQDKCLQRNHCGEAEVAGRRSAEGQPSTQRLAIVRSLAAGIDGGTWAWLAMLLCLVAPANARERPNVLLICVDDLRPELNCFGVDYIQSPHIDALAAAGQIFTRHYVQAPTCGASRYALLTGRYGGASNGALFSRAKKLEGSEIPPSMPAWFRQHGYTTVSVGKVSHHPGGLGGPDWNDPDQPEMPDSWDRHLLDAGPWLHPRGWMHGLANGEIRGNAKEMDVFQSLEGPDAIYPDGRSTESALRELRQLAGDKSKPFFLAFGILRPHLPFGAPKKYLELYRNTELPPILHPEKPAGKTTWHRSGEFMKYNRWGKDPNEDADFATQVRKHYAACVSYADAQVGRILGELERLGETENTVVVLWGDHGWHLGEHAIWGKHALFEESLRSPLIVSYAAGDRLLKDAACDSICETIDVFPTLCELSGVPIPEFAQGSSLVAALQGRRSSGNAALSYFGRAKTLRTEQYRLIAHDDGFDELYSKESDPGETKNIAEMAPQVVARLKSEIKQKLNSSD